jgi:hypothetical protein
MNQRDAKKNKIEKSIALLSLAHGEQAAPGPCPAAEELAAMIEGRLNREQSEQIQDHLGSCTKCYQQWLTFALPEMIGEEKRRSTRTFIPRRVLGYLGTTLAAAASIALYLNLTSTGVKETAVFMQKVQKEDNRPRVSGKTDLAAPQIFQDNKVDAPSPPVVEEKGGNEAAKARTFSQQPLPSAPIQPQRAAKQKVASDAIRILPREETQPQAPSAPPPPAALVAEQASSAAMDAELQSDKAGAGYQTLSLGAWYDLVALGCKNPQMKKNEWQAMYDGGQKILQSGQLNMPEKKQQLSRILEKINNILSTGATEPYCREIHDDLAPSTGKK